MTELPNLLPALPELVLVGAALLLLLVGVFQKRNATDLVGILAAVALLLAGFMELGLGGQKAMAFRGMFITDGFAVFSKIMVLTAALLTLLMALSWLRREMLGRFEFPVLILLATTGMMLMISANDLMSLYIGLELQSLTLYILAAYNRDNARSTEAGLKYFVLGALASGLLLFGASFIYGFAGSTSFEILGRTLNADSGAGFGVTIGMVFIMAGLAFKISAAPFHMWTPDVYEGAPTPVTAFFSAAPKLAAMALLVRVMTGPFGGLASAWQQVIIVLSVASMVVGAFAAINQTNIKRLMAYSSIGHVGYALIGVAVGNAVGVRGVLVYLAIYLLMNLGTFAVILSMRQKGRLAEEIGDLSGLSRTHPVMAFALAVLMFSMAGIPPMAGFFGKLYIFLAAVDSHLYGLAVIGVLSSVVGAFYYLRIIKVMYFDEPVEVLDGMGGRAISLVLAGSSVAILFFFLVPGPLLNGAEAAAKSLFGG